MSLTPKQARFVEEYLVDLNATQAAVRAGYSERRASEIGHQLLQKTTVAEAVQQKMAERSERTQVTADMVLRELARIGFSDVWNYRIDDFGRLILADNAPEDASRAVASVKHRTKTIPTKDGEPIVEHTVEFKLWDKNTALANIGKHLGMFVDRVEHAGEGGGPIAVRVTRVIVRPDGDGA